MITKEIILCKCHRQPVRTKTGKGKPFEQKKYFCTVKDVQLLSNNFIYEKVKVNLRDPDDTRDGSEVQCPEDLEKAYEDYKKKAAGNGE